MNRVIKSEMEIAFDNIPLKIPYSHKEAVKGHETLFFIYSLGCTEESFDGIWKEKGLENYSALTFDLPGFGNSSKSKKF